MLLRGVGLRGVVLNGVGLSGVGSSGVMLSVVVFQHVGLSGVMFSALANSISVPAPLETAVNRPSSIPDINAEDSQNPIAMF